MTLTIAREDLKANLQQAVHANRAHADRSELAGLYRGKAIF